MGRASPRRPRGVRSGQGRLTDISRAVESRRSASAGPVRHRATATAATASAPRCTRTRTCSTTAGPGGARAWCPAWPGHRADDHAGLAADGGALRRLDRGHPGRLGRRARRAHRGAARRRVWVLTAAGRRPGPARRPGHRPRRPDRDPSSGRCVRPCRCARCADAAPTAGASGPGLPSIRPGARRLADRRTASTPACPPALRWAAGSAAGAGGPSIRP